MTGQRLIGAIEAGGTKIVCAVADAGGGILARTTLATAGPDTTLRDLRRFFDQASREHGKIAGFGLGSFGPLNVDPRSPGYGTIAATPKTGWTGVCWREVLAPFAAPLAIETDVDAAALGEWTHGAGQGCRTLAYTTVGTGIGSGVLHAGVPLRGFSHLETGHIPVPHDLTADPFAGLCPYHGDCLEGLASGPAITARWGRDLSHLPETAVSLIAGYLGHLAATLVLMHMPDRLVFGGGVMQAPGLIEAVRARTRARLAGYVAGPALAAELATYIVPPALGGDAGLAGALILGRRAAGPM